jgi:predicted O-methyltransferase YrrM
MAGIYIWGILQISIFMINPHFVLSFIKHYWQATRIDVLHSPFVFELYNSCIARQQHPDALKEINQVWKEALNNSTSITQNDLGAWGHKQQQRTKPVSYFAKNHAKPGRLAAIIYRMVNKYHYSNCIELGTSLGYTTMHIAAALQPGARFNTIEGAEEVAAVARDHFRRTSLDEKIGLITGNFDDVLPALLETYPTIDFAFIDGNHTYEATIDYFQRFLKKINNNSVLVFDDINWSKGMSRAWEEIRQHPDVTITVDLFFIGLVFFRKEQVKEHFKLRVW